MKICIIYSFKSELYVKNTFLKRESEMNKNHINMYNIQFQA